MPCKRIIDDTRHRCYETSQDVTVLWRSLWLQNASALNADADISVSVIMFHVAFTLSMVEICLLESERKGGHTCSLDLKKLMIGYREFQWIMWFDILRPLQEVVIPIPKDVVKLRAYDVTPRQIVQAMAWYLCTVLVTKFKLRFCQRRSIALHRCICICSGMFTGIGGVCISHDAEAALSANLNTRIRQV